MRLVFAARYVRFSNLRLFLLVWDRAFLIFRFFDFLGDLEGFRAGRCDWLADFCSSHNRNAVVVLEMADSLLGVRGLSRFVLLVKSADLRPERFGFPPGGFESWAGCPCWLSLEGKEFGSVEARLSVEDGIQGACAGR